MRMVRLLVGSSDIVEAEMRQRIEQVRPAEPVTELRASATEARNTQTMHIILPVQRVAEAFGFGRCMNSISIFQMRVGLK